MSDVKRVGLVGARGYTGREFLGLLARHEQLDLAFASSRRLAGRPLSDVVTGWGGDDTFLDLPPEAVVDQESDVLVLALPNGVSDQYLQVIPDDTIVIDLSADHRFDHSWVYGLPELNRAQLLGSTRISNPGCYATAAMLALAPIAADLAAEPSVFGVSGFSGAGTDPSPKNDPETLRDNVMPYKITGHVHEREIGHQLGRSVRFAPSVAPFERGLVVTALATLEDATDVEQLRVQFEDRYPDEVMVELAESAPLPRQAAGRPQAIIGGLSVDDRDPRRVGVVAALDNLLKGAASQALQNLNLACGFEETAGIL